MPYLAALAVTGATGFAANATMPEWAPLINMGGVGAVLFWFLWKLEPRLRAMESAIERCSDAVLVLTIALDHDQAKQQAERIQADIKKARKVRGESEE